MATHATPTCSAPTTTAPTTTAPTTTAPYNTAELYRIFVWRKKGSVAERSTPDDRIKYADLENEVLQQGQQALDIALGILPQTMDLRGANKREQFDEMLQQRQMMPGVAGNPFFQKDCYLEGLGHATCAR